MKTKFLFTTLLSFYFYLLSSQVPQGFNYQAIARDGSGNPITGATIKVKLSILTDSTNFFTAGGSPANYIWEEEHTNVKTNAFGLFTIVLGNPLATKIQGTAASFSSIPWSQSPLYVGTKIANPTTYKIMGSARLWSVPYSMIAGDLEGAVKKLAVVGEDVLSDEALFEVKRKDGETMFAVYNHGVRVFMPLDTMSKSRKGGFAIGGFDKTKGTTTFQDYFVVNPDSIRAYIDTNPVKARKGGFAIGGFDKTKAGNEEYLRVTRDSTRIYLNDTGTKARKGGFAIGGFDKTKGGIQDFLTVSTDSIRMFIDDTPVKARKGGFAIGGFDKAKAGNTSFLNVATDESGIINPSQNRILWYPLRNAFLTGKVLIEKPDSVGVNSFASGYESKAKGQYSQALGYKTIARGDYSTAIGKDAVANKISSFSFGENVLANGENSYAFGMNSVASGEKSFAFGYNSIASKNGSFAFGFSCQSTSFNSFALGSYCIASGANSFAIGEFANSIGAYSTALGNYTKATKEWSTAMGHWTESNNWYATSMGDHTKANGIASTAMGQATFSNGANSTSMGTATTSRGTSSVAMGNRTISNSFAALTIGQWNDTTCSLTGYKEWISADPLFICGNGIMSPYPNIIYSNALILYKNGNLTISGTLTQNSDVRMKINVIPIGDVTEELQKINPVYFEFKDQVIHPRGRQIGFIAQEIEPLFPELVSRDGQGYLSVDYSRLSAVILKAFKEQQLQIEAQQREIDELKGLVNTLIANQTGSGNK